MNRKEAANLEAEMRKMGLHEEEERQESGATWRNRQEAGAGADDNVECDCEDCSRPGPDEKVDKEGGAGQEPDWSGFCPPGPFGRRGKGPWGGLGGRGPFGGHRGGPFGPMAPWMMMMNGHGMGPMGGPMGGPVGGPMGGPMGGCGMGSMGRPWGPGGPWGPFGRCGGFRPFRGPGPFRSGCTLNADGEENAEKKERRQMRRQERRAAAAAAQTEDPNEPMDASGDEADPDDVTQFLPPWMRRFIKLRERLAEAEGPRKEKILQKMRCIAMRRFTKAQQQKAKWTQMETSSSDDDSDDVTEFLPPWMRRFIKLRERLAEAEGPRKEKILQKMRCIAMRRSMMAQQQGPWASCQPMGFSSSDDDSDDVTEFLPPWVRRFIKLRGRLAEAEGPRKEKILQKMRCIAMRRSMMAQQHQGPWWCQSMTGHPAAAAMSGPPFMGPHFGGPPTRPWWMKQRLGGRCGGRKGFAPMWWGSEESNSEDNEQDATAATKDATKDKSKVTGPAAEAGERVSSSDDDDEGENIELPPHLPPWMANFIEMRRQKAKAHSGCDADRKQHRRWARRCMAAGGAPWCGPPNFQGPPGPGYFWAMQQHRPGMWRKMMKHYKRAAKETSKQPTDTKPAKCQHCGAAK